MGNLFDSTNYPDGEPGRLVVGDRWLWKRADLGVDYPPASYALTYSLRLESAGTEIEITASESGGDYLVEVASATTAAYTAGKYRWQAYITRSSDSQRITIGTGWVEVVANRDAATGDPRTHARIVLAAIEAVIEGKATKDQQSYSVEGVSLSRYAWPELVALRARYRDEVAREDAAERRAAGKPSRRKIRAMF